MECQTIGSQLFLASWNFETQIRKIGPTVEKPECQGCDSNPEALMDEFSVRQNRPEMTTIQSLTRPSRERLFASGDLVGLPQRGSALPRTIGESLDVTYTQESPCPSRQFSPAAIRGR